MDNTHEYSTVYRQLLLKGRQIIFSIADDNIRVVSWTDECDSNFMLCIVNKSHISRTMTAMMTSCKTDTMILAPFLRSMFT